MQHTDTLSPGLDTTLLYSYEQLLFKIAISLGLTAKQSADTISEVFLQWQNESLDKTSRGISIKVYLSKLLVSRCIFRISNELFSCVNYKDVQLSNAGVCYNCLTLTSIKLKKVPLSYRVALVLNALSEFSEEEIGEVLNISPMKVKERIKKAYSYIA